MFIFVVHEDETENAGSLGNADPQHDAAASNPIPPPLKPDGPPTEEVIRSPLDQRCYKSITLPNGVKVMLISTYNVEYYESEQDATLPPCQVPEVSEFNKRYLGYDNPAAKTRCACPCDKQKACCGSSAQRHRGDKNNEELWKATCCGGGNKEIVENVKQPGPSHQVPGEHVGLPPPSPRPPATTTTDEETGKGSKNVPLTLQGNKMNHSSNSRLGSSSPAFCTNCPCSQKNFYSSPEACCCKVTEKAPSPAASAIQEDNLNEKGKRDVPLTLQANNRMNRVPNRRPMSRSRTFCKSCQCCQKNAKNQESPTNQSEASCCKLTEDESTPEADVTKKEDPDPVRKTRRPSKHYPFPPQFVQGINTAHTCPTGGTRPRTNRPHNNSDVILDLEGTVYLVIGSGYFDDPNDQPGLAHFCEHAVFLGSEKFPEPNQLFKLVLPFDGYVNAYTSGISTTFTSSASYRLFPLAVEILADMVGFPLFPNDLVAAELEALDSEYSLRQDDTPKYFQLIGSLAKKGHVIRKMDSGNISTLRVPNYYRKLVEWRRIYYCPNRMTLALEAPFPIEYLEMLATETFGRIPVGHLAAPNRIRGLGCPFDMKRFHQIYHVPSVHHSEFLALHWHLDSRAWKNLKVKPLDYLGAIIAHTAEGGLTHYLVSRGLATNVDAGCWESDVTRNHYTSVFSVSVDLTEKGFKKQDSILQAIFGYIQMLIRNGPQKTFFHELQKQQLESFHFKAAESSQSLAENVSRWMQFIPPKWCLIAPILTCQFDAELIKKCTESLTVESANVIVFSKNYGGELKEVGGAGKEEFYDTPFTSYDFPIELEHKVKKTKEEYSHKFVLPPMNPLLLQSTCTRSSEKELLQKGALLKVKGKISLAYMSRKVTLVRGLLPQAKYSVWIGSPVTSYLGAAEGSGTKLIILSRYLNALFRTKFYHASNADIQLETEASQGELHLVLAGAHTLLPCLLEQVLNLLDTFENVAEPHGFEVVRCAFIENLDGTILDNRFLAWDLYYYLWTNNHELIFDHRRNAENLTLSSFLRFVKSFKKQMYIQAHLYGYVTKVQGEQIAKSFETLNYESIELREYLLLRCMRQKLGERVIKVNSQNPSIHTSVVLNSYQFGMVTDEEEEAINFLAKTMSDAAFYKLRTEQQLGYIIIIYAEVTFGVSSIIVELVTQPKNFTTEHCNQCIDNFLLDFFNENLSSEKTYLEFCLGKPKLDLPFNALRNLFQTFLLPNPQHYRKLSVQVVGLTEEEAKRPSQDTENMKQTAFPGKDGYENSGNYNREETTVGGITRVHKTLSMGGAKSTIMQVRNVKKSLQVREGYLMYSKLRKGSTGRKITPLQKANVCSRMVKNLGKFKKSLTYYPVST